MAMSKEQAGHLRRENFPAKAPTGRLVNALTVDVEDYFQVEVLSSCFPREGWSTVACRVEANVDRLLGLLQTAGACATFFTLGWIAERYPTMVRRIVAGGHEIASHGYSHCRADRQNTREFQEDIRKSKRLLETIT